MNKTSRTLHTRTLDYIQKKRLWKKGECITLSVSGGVDSMVLLDVIVRTQGAHKGEIRVVTFDHGLRAEGQEETRLVRSAAEQRGLSCEIYQLNLSKGSHLQERARNARREILISSAEGVIATGHHSNDQAETVLFRLLRGSGLTGLRGMLPKQGRFVRPLLFAHKDEILQYAQQREIHWMEDPSNPSSVRGQLRSLFPLLAKVRDNPISTLSRSAQLLARDEEYLSERTRSCWQRLNEERGISLNALRKEHPALQLRVLRTLTMEYGFVPSARQSEDFLDWFPKKGATLALRQGYHVFFDGECLRIQK